MPELHNMDDNDGWDIYEDNAIESFMVEDDYDEPMLGDDGMLLDDNGSLSDMLKLLDGDSDDSPQVFEITEGDDDDEFTINLVPGSKKEYEKFEEEKEEEREKDWKTDKDPSKFISYLRKNIFY